jgi:SOS-response transcriptional repressor LexA
MSTNNINHTSISNNLIKNINSLIKKSCINQVELSRLANIPYSTLNGIITGVSSNPRLHTLLDIATFFDIKISQLVGEIPLNFSETTIPILEWSDIDFKEGIINFNITQDTKYISCTAHYVNPLFALRATEDISDIYKNNSIFIIEKTTDYKNNDFAILSINQSEPVIKRIIKESSDIYIESISKNIPPQIFNEDIMKIFGLIRETRIVNYPTTKERF